MKTRAALVALVTAIALAAAAALAGCSSAQPEPSSPSASANASATPSPSPTPTVSPSAGSSAAPTGSASSPVGSWGEDGAGKPSAVFNSDGTVSGSDGCNRFSATWTDSGGTIEIGVLVATQVGCPGMDTWLTMMRSVKVDGDTLVVYKGTEKIGTLARA
ncbi:META domain-containing protein [Leifsonia sp. NPDC058248]|uniref:META domain-containing protein n=1 Tax=Leifsonia sp. NPDC058248 TaxID=3346402 RepID=UPI0036D94EBE